MTAMEMIFLRTLNKNDPGIVWHIRKPFDLFIVARIMVDIIRIGRDTSDYWINGVRNIKVGVRIENHSLYALFLLVLLNPTTQHPPFAIKNDTRGLIEPMIMRSSFVSIINTDAFFQLFILYPKV